MKNSRDYKREPCHGWVGVCTVILGHEKEGWEPHRIHEAGKNEECSRWAIDHDSADFSASRSAFNLRENVREAVNK